MEIGERGNRKIRKNLEIGEKLSIQASKISREKIESRCNCSNLDENEANNAEKAHPTWQREKNVEGGKQKSKHFGRMGNGKGAKGVDLSNQQRSGALVREEGRLLLD